MTAASRFSPLLVSVALFALCQAPLSRAQTTCTLRAKLALTQRNYASDADVEVTVELTNTTSRVIDVPAQVLATATLLLDVRDASGKHVATVSPPVPRPDVIHFAPGEHRTSKLRLDVFSPPLPPGDYVVTTAPSVATGASVPFRIARSTP